MSASATCKLYIDLDAICANHALIQNRVATGAQIAPVIKANAYGLGADAIIPALDSLSPPLYFVATLDEAIAARAVTQKPIAVLSGIQNRDEARLCTSSQFIPALNTIPQIVTAKEAGIQTPVILHIDTGMNRLGLDIKTDIQKLETKELDVTSLPIQMIMSHFACADEAGNPMNKVQADAFNDVTRRLASILPRPFQKSLSNSGGIFQNKSYHHDIVRPGAALYGLFPLTHEPSPLAQPVRYTAQVLQIRPAHVGETCGYNARYTIKTPGTLAILGMGYADGLARAAGPHTMFYWKGHPCPIRGSVSMDYTIVDLTDLPLSIPHPVPGEEMELIGPNQSPDDLARTTGTIGYEILTNISARTARVYIKADKT